MLAIYYIPAAIDTVYLGGCSYFDELLAIICLLYCALYVWKSGSIDKSDREIIAVMFLLLIGGLASNIVFHVQQNLVAVILDILATYKSFIIYFAFKWKYKNPERNRRTLHSVAKLLHGYVVICACFAAINLFANIQMSSGYDFGLKNFRFIFDGPGNYAMPFYAIAFSVCMDCAMKGYYTRKDKRNIALMLFAWIASLTTRSIVYVVLYVAAILIAKYFTRGKIKKRHIIAFAIIALAIGYSTIVYYFRSSNLTARGVLLSYSILVLKKYFPLGAGFASYGSNMAAAYYSPLYEQFGFNAVWGLSKANPSFANDSFWPEIMGQFGFLGVILICWILYKWYKKISNMKISPSERIICQWFFIVMLIGSSGTKTYIHHVTIGVYILIALYENAIGIESEYDGLQLQEEHDAGWNNNI